MDFYQIAQTVARDLERETCSVHGKHPKLVVSGSRDKPSVNVTACCDDFAGRIRDKFSDIMGSKVSDAAKKDIGDMFKNFGR